ncbi:universal stress protein [Saccharothrix sp. AJ9571]|nr:universal stress protein [Saccharothrix sp. AJ9571]
MTTSGATAAGSILAGFDGSDGSRRAVHWAAAEATRRRCPLLVVQCFAWAPPIMQGWTSAGDTEGARIRQHAEYQLGELAEQCRKARPELVVETALPEGRAGVVLPEVAEDVGAALIVVGSSGLGAFPRVLLGSTAADVVRAADRPVIVVRGDDPEPATAAEAAPVVVGVDGSPTSDRAIEFAFEFAAGHGSPLLAVHAWSDWPVGLLAAAPMPPAGWDRQDAAAEAAVRAHLDEYAERFPDVRAEVRFVADQPARVLTEMGEYARLLVVGSHGRGAVGRAFLGSVSHAVLYHAPCPVAVLRDTGEDSR